jgi:hypothetical protein
MRRNAQQALKTFALLLALLACLDLAGCASTRHRAREAKKPEVKVACPKAEVLADARSVVQFKEGTGRDLTDIQYQAQVNQLQSRCKNRGESEASIDITASFTAWLGPAAPGHTLSLPYFVAVTRGDDILSKENFTVDIGFEKEARQTTVAAEVKRLPISLERGEQPVEVVVGIQLTPEQVAYNRAHGS